MLVLLGFLKKHLKFRSSGSRAFDEVTTA